MLTLGIIGYGYMGKIRHQEILKRSDSTVKAIYHTQPLAGNFNYCDSWKEIVNDYAIDAVFVCVPNHMTGDIVVASLEQGKHVFAEKPPGVSLEQVKRMQAAEQESKKKLKFGFNHRYHPAIIRAKELVESGDFGEILWMRGRYGKSVEADFDANWRSQKKFAGGGILMDQGIHMLDLMQYFCGDFTEAKAFASNLYWKGDVEDNVFAILKNEKGQVASLHSTITQWRYLFSLEIFLSKGYLVVNGLLSKSGRYGQERLDYAQNRTPAPMAAHSEMHSITFNTDLSWKMEIDEFINAINKNSQILIGNSYDAYRLMALVERIYEDAGILSGCD